jgi:hypothetical protein
MTNSEFCSYQGVYQAYAWQQGYANAPVVFRLPDENFVIGEWGDEHCTEGFDLLKFFRVVAEIDNEGAIHSWEYFESPGDRGPYVDRFVRLTCSEDDSQLHPDYHDDKSGHAEWHIARLSA